MTDHSDLPGELMRRVRDSLAQGRSVVVARLVEEPELVMLVWGSGEVFGDLGAPRLNQRVATYGERLAQRGGEDSRKMFEGEEGPLEVDFTLFEAADA